MRINLKPLTTRKVRRARFEEAAGAGGAAPAALPDRDEMLLAYVTPRDGFDFSPELAHEPLAYRVGSAFRETLGLAETAPSLKPGWADYLTDEPRSTTTYYCKPYDKARLAKNIDRDRSTRLFAISRGASHSEQYEAAAAIELQDALLEMVYGEGEEFFETTVYHTLIARDREELAAFARDKADDAKASRAMTLKCVRNNQQASFLAASPLMVEDKTSVEQLAKPLPACTLGAGLLFTRRGLHDPVGNDIGHDASGGRVRLNMTRTGEHRTNMNVAILGQSGMGKTTLLRKLINEWLAEGCVVIAVDPEGELREQCRNASGQWVNVGGSSKAMISPTQPRVAGLAKGDEDDTPPADVLHDTIAFLRAFLATAFKLDEDDLALFEKVAKGVYAEHGITYDTTPADIDADAPYPDFAMIHAAALRAAASASGAVRNRLESMAAKLWVACEGSMAKLWCGRTTVTRQSDFVVLDTHALDGHDPATKAAQYFNTMSWIWDQVVAARAANRPVKVVIDECHLVINAKSPVTTERIAAMIKRARKYNAGIVCATQQVEDLLGVDPTILNQSTYRFLFGGDTSHHKNVVKLFDLTQGMSDALSGCVRGECLVLAGREATKARVEVRDWERAMFAEEARVTAEGGEG